MYRHRKLCHKIRVFEFKNHVQICDVGVSASWTGLSCQHHGYCAGWVGPQCHREPMLDLVGIEANIAIGFGALHTGIHRDRDSRNLMVCTHVFMGRERELYVHHVPTVVQRRVCACRCFCVAYQHSLFQANLLCLIRLGQSDIGNVGRCCRGFDVEVQEYHFLKKRVEKCTVLI